LVCRRYDVESEAERYLAQHIQPGTSIADLDIDLMLRAAGQVESVLGIARAHPVSAEDARHGGEIAGHSSGTGCRPRNMAQGISSPSA